VHDHIDDFDDKPVREGAQSFHAHDFTQGGLWDAIFGLIVGEESLHCLQHFGCGAVSV